jgi:transposase
MEINKSSHEIEGCEIKMVDIHKKINGKKISKKYNVITAEKRNDLIRSLENGSMNRKNAAKNFGLPYQTVVTIYKRYCKTGKIEIEKKCGGRTKKLNMKQTMFIKNLIDEDCTITLNGIKAEILAKENISISLTAISNYISNFHYSFKRINIVPKITLTEDIDIKRVQFSEWFLNARNDQKILIFYDETGFQVTMRKFYGRSKKGERAVNVAPAIKTKNITVLAGMTSEKLIFYEISKIPANRTILKDYLGNLFTLLDKEKIKNANIIMDNASFHKCTEIKEFVEEREHKIVYLPPYSPFFNPIENLFSQWKQHIRSRSPKNEEELFHYIDNFQYFLSNEQCKNYFQHVTNNMIGCLSGKDTFNL